MHHLALHRQADFSVSEGETRRQESRGGSRSRARSACFLLTLPYPHPFPLQPSPPTLIPCRLTGSRAQLSACSVAGLPVGLGAGGEPWSQHSAMSLKAPPSCLSGSLRPALPWLIPGLPSTPAAWCPGSAVPWLRHWAGTLGPPPCVRALTRPLVAGSGLRTQFLMGSQLATFPSFSGLLARRGTHPVNSAHPRRPQNGQIGIQLEALKHWVVRSGVRIRRNGQGLGVGVGQGSCLEGAASCGFPPAIHSSYQGSESPFIIIKSSLLGKWKWTLNEMVFQRCLVECPGPAKCSANAEPGPSIPYQPRPAPTGLLRGQTALLLLCWA